jgi:hypothetical protein
MAASTGHASASCAGVRPLRSLWGRQDEDAEMNQVLIDVRSGRRRVLSSGVRRGLARLRWAV